MATRFSKKRSKILITVYVTECLTFVMATAIPQFELFDIHANDAIAQRQRKWIKWLENLFVAAAISDKKRQRALLLYFAREEVSEIFDTLPDTGEDFETAKTKLNMYFDLKKNVEFEIFTFRQAKQNPGETMDSHHSRLITTVSNYLWIHWNRILMRMWGISTNHIDAPHFINERILKLVLNPCCNRISLNLLMSAYLMMSSSMESTQRSMTRPCMLS